MLFLIEFLFLIIIFHPHDCLKYRVQYPLNQRVLVDIIILIY